jgi:hypothetical protein
MTQESVQGGPEYWKQRAYDIGQQHGLDPYKFTRLINWESGFNPLAGGPERAYGIAQFMPSWVSGGTDWRTDPEASLQRAAQYLVDLQKSLGDEKKAYAAYFYGEQGLYDYVLGPAGSSADWEAFMDPAYRNELEYVWAGAALEHALTPVAAAYPPFAQVLAPLFPALKARQRVGFEEVPEYFAGYRQMLRDSLNAVELTQNHLEGSSIPLTQTSTGYITPPTKEEIYDWYAKHGYTQEQVDTASALVGLSEKVLQQRLEGMPWMKYTDLSRMPSWSDVARMVRESKLPAVNTAAAEHVAALDEYQHASTRAYIITWLPYAMSSGEVKTVEDIDKFFQEAGPQMTSADQTLARPQVSLSQEDREFFSDLITRLSPSIPPKPTATVQEVTQALTQTYRPHPVVLSSVTTDELIKYYTSLGGPMQPPAGLTSDQLRGVLSDMGLTDEQYQKMVNDTGEAARRLGQDWYSQYLTIQTYRAGITVPEIPKLSAWQKVKMAITQPALAAGEAMDAFRRKFEQPLAAGEILAVNRIIGKVGLPPIRGTASLEAQYKASLAEGMGGWSAFGAAFQEWNAPGAVKFLAETVGDPINYVGLGIATKGARAFSSLPIIESTPFLRSVGPVVAATESGWNSAWDRLLFWPLRLTYKAIPKTAEQLAAELIVDEERGVIPLLNRTVAAYFRRPNGLQDAAETDLPEVVAAALRESVTSPGAPSGKLGELGTALLRTTTRPITEDELGQWAVRLGAKAEVTKQTVVDVNYIYEKLQYSGIHGLLKTQEAAPLLLQKLGVEASDNTLRLASELLGARIRRDVGAVLNIFNRPMAESLPMLSNIVRATFQSNLKLGVMKFANQSGMAMTLARHSSDILNLKGMTMLDNYVVKPVAQMYLWMLSYNPMNIAEEWFRAWRGGVAVPLKPGAYVVDEFMHYLGYLKVPSDLALGGPRLEIAIVPEPGHTLVPMEPRKFPVPIPGVTRELPIGRIPAVGKYIPKQWYSFQNMNVGGAQISQRMRAVYVLTKYPDQLQLVDRAGFENIVRAQAALKKLGITSLSHSDIAELQRGMLLNSIHGPDAVRAMAQRADQIAARKYTADVAQAVGEHLAIPEPNRNYIIDQARRGLLPGKVDEVMEASWGGVQDEYITRLRARAVNLKNWADEVMGTPITTDDELWRAVRMANDMTDAVERQISEFRSTVTQRGHQLTVAERDKLHEAAHGDLLDFMGAIEDDLGRVQSQLRDLVKAGDLEEKLGPVLDNMIERRQLLIETRTEQHSILEQARQLAGPGKRPDWDAVYRDWEDLWQSTWNNLDRLMTEAQSRSMILSKPIGTIDKVTGDLAPINVARLFGTTGDDLSRNLYTETLTAMMTKRRFTSYIKMQAEVLANLTGESAASMGYTDESIGRVYDQLLAKIRVDATDGPLSPLKQELEGLRQKLHGITATKGVKPEDVEKLNRALEDTASKLQGSGLFTNTGEATPAWAASREKAMDQTRMAYEMDFTDYTHMNMFDAFMRRIFPFWTYESQRWPYLARAFIQTPGIFTSWGRYIDYSDTGYMHIPGTDLQMDPFRGTVLMGGLRRFYLRDYPEYYDQFRGFSEVMDYISRAGFYPGIQVTLPQAAFGAKSPALGPQFGEILPAWLKTGISGLVGANVPYARELQETFFPDRFRNYQILLTVNKIAEQRHIPLDQVDGTRIWEKMVEGIELTPQEQSIWNEATSHVGRMSVLFEQTGLFRMRPEELVRARDYASKVYEALTGVPKELQDVVSQRNPVTGERFSDLFPLDPLDQEYINSIESIKRWTRTVTPLLPSEYQRTVVRIGEYWDSVEHLTTAARTDDFKDDKGNVEAYSLQHLSEMFIRGEITADQYLQMQGDTQARLSAGIDALHQSDYFKDVPITLDERVAFAQEHNLPQPTFSPGEELVAQYYELKPQLRRDPETGQLTYDFDTYFAQTDALIESLPDAVKQRFLAYIHRNWTDTQKLYWTISREYLRPYRNLREAVIQQFTPDEQEILRRYSSTEGAEQAALEEITMADGNKLIATFTKDLRTARLHMRRMDPTLEAWLYFWGKVTEFNTADSEAIYADLMQQYRPEAQ